MFTIDLFDKSDNIDKDAIQKIVDDFAKILNLEPSGEQIIEIRFVGKEEMKKINNKYRNINASTDVLSFAQAKNPSSSTRNIYGSILISKEDAEERQESIEDLIKHGLLHLAGYDHESDARAWDHAAKLINHHMG